MRDNQQVAIVTGGCRGIGAPSPSASPPRAPLSASTSRPAVMGRVLGIVYRLIATHLIKAAPAHPWIYWTGINSHDEPTPHKFARSLPT
jgi:hypothetical protein